MSSPRESVPQTADPAVEKDDAPERQVSAEAREAGAGEQTAGKKTFGQKTWELLKEPGSALQIVIAAALAIAIGMAVTTTVGTVPIEAQAILAIPGTLWLRALKAVVLPLIVTAMMLATQKLRAMTGSGQSLARWTVGYYVATTLAAIGLSCVLVARVWAPLMTRAGDEALALAGSDAAEYRAREDVRVHEVVVQMFESLVPANVVQSLATNDLLAVLVSAVVVGGLVRGPDSPLLRAAEEVERVITAVITFLIKLAPLGVFFLILPNLMRLRLGDVGANLGLLIGASLSGMAIHLFLVLPAIFYAVTRRNPYAYWLRHSPAWITAWGTASSAATLSVTLRCVRANGVPNTVNKFAVPLGCLVNMDGTAIYFPAVVVFMAATQGIELNAADYVIVCLLSTLASIGTTPIPSSSLVLTVMIAGSVNVPLTGMYAVVVAIDWFIDRFRTATNVSGDIFAAAILAKITGITDPDDDEAVDEDVEPGVVGVRAEGDDRV